MFFLLALKAPSKSQFLLSGIVFHCVTALTEKAAVQILNSERVQCSCCWGIAKLRQLDIQYVLLKHIQYH